LTVKIKGDIGCKQCLICDQDIGEAAILLAVGDAIAAIHPTCAKRVCIELLKDLSILTGLGYEVEYEEYGNTK